MSHRALLARWLAPLCVLAASACVGDIPSRSASRQLEHAPRSAPVASSVAESAPQPHSAPRVRLLSAVAYRNAVRDLLGVEAAQALPRSAAAAGAADTTSVELDEQRIAQLLDDAQRASDVYVRTRIARDYPCFDPAKVSDACISEIAAQLGERAHRRPLSAEQHASLVSLFQRVASATSDRASATRSLIARIIVSARFARQTS